MTDLLQPASAESGAVTREITVWDLVVRVGHWSLVILFAVAYLTGDELRTVHAWAGYGIVLYLVARIAWGFAGGRYARFSDFAYGPVAAATYLRDLLRGAARRHLGHSPAGAVMVFALLLGLAASTGSGMALLAVEHNSGPLAPWLGSAGASAIVPAAAEDDDDDEDRAEGRNELLEEAHEIFVNLTLTLVLLHVAGVALASFAHRENLVRAMITGRKRRA